jgi:hypothetical protein
MLAWRNQWGESGVKNRLTLNRAEHLGEGYTDPRSWAAIIDGKEFVFVREYGTRFKDLQQAAKESPCAVGGD